MALQPRILPNDRTLFNIAKRADDYAFGDFGSRFNYGCGMNVRQLLSLLNQLECQFHLGGKFSVYLCFSLDAAD